MVHRRFLAAGLLLLAGAAPADGPAEQDIFLRQAALAPGDAEARLLLDMEFGKPDAADRLRARLAQTPPPDAAFTARALSALCGYSYRAGRYRQAVADCTSSAQADPANGDDDTLAVARALADVAPPSVKGAGASVAFADGRIAVRAGNYAGPAFPDTGATISVMMRSVAEQAHVRLMGRSRSVGTSTASVSGEIGVIPEIAIGDATVADLPTLVLPDAQLTYDNGNVKIPFLLGLPALKLFGRIAWLDRGTRFALGDRAPALSAGAVPAFLHPLGIGIALDGPGGRRDAHFDTGSNVTFLFEPGIALVSEKERAALVQSTRRMGGVGGVVTENVRRLPTATLSLAGQPFVLSNAVVAAAPKTGEAARVGADIFARYGAVVLDFERMQFSVAP